jgi:hypothetical protein
MHVIRFSLLKLGPLDLPDNIEVLTIANERIYEDHDVQYCIHSSADLSSE